MIKRQMKTNATTLMIANTAFRNQDFQGAIAYYKEALISIEEPLRALIHFNLDLAEKRYGACIERETKIQDQSLDMQTNVLEVKIENWWDIQQDISSHFDSDFYRSKYSDIEQANVEPLEHYCRTGWLEGRDPRSDFSTATYLEMNPDVATAGINPFWHYVVAGKSEGRATSHPGGIKAEILKALPSLKQIVLQWKISKIPPLSMTVAEVKRVLIDNISDRINSLVISVGHDHYKKVSGGIQFCIQREEYLANEQDMLYINVHPWQPLPILASTTQDPDPIISLVIAGQDIGVCHSATLTLALKQILLELGKNIFVVIHSLLGHSIECVKEWVKLHEDRKCWFWLHDFFTLCPSYALQRNNITFCGAPPVDSNACSICIYGDERRLHLERMNKFFENISVTAIAPSEVTKKFWLSKFQHTKTDVIVHPHMQMHWLDRMNKNLDRLIKPIYIGFLGGAVYHKGWNTFENLVNILEGDPRFKFFHLGNRRSPLGAVKHINVHVTTDDCLAMTRTVSEEEIDFVLHWATWPETFSFTTHEAIAGGAYVLTNQISGNVAATVVTTGRGMIFQDEQELAIFFKDGSAEKMVKTIRSNNNLRKCEPVFSEMAITFLKHKGEV